MPIVRGVATLILVATSLTCGLGTAADPFWGADPVWGLMHEPAVERELRLSSDQQRRFHALLDELDARCFPLRNQSADVAASGVADILSEAERRLPVALAPAQVRRFLQIQTRQQGTTALLTDGMAKQMRYAAQQRDRLNEAVTGATAATSRLEQRLNDGEPRETLEAEYREVKAEELRLVNQILTPAQRTIWQKSLGKDFALQSLGRPRYRAPRLIDSGHWINSEPLSSESLAGKVVVLHFYASGCINCVHNYPTYLEWDEAFPDDEVVILGVHTPETPAEENAASVRQKAADAGLRFPILIDGTKANWNAWGNSMWPAVYLIDRQGYLRFFWPGELKWKGATGDAWMRERIDELLAEPATP